MDWLHRFAEYEAALAAHGRAQGCIDQLQTRLTTCGADDERAAINAGLAVATQRARLTGKALAAATNAFTAERSVLEAVWAAPDDI